MMSQTTMNERSVDYQRVERAIEFLSESFREQPSLAEIAAHVHLSKYHFQRLFKRWAGVTPTQFLQYLTLEYAKERLKESESILSTALDAGLSGPSRLHDLFVTFESITPGEFKASGRDLQIDYGFHASPFGGCVLAMTDRGVCGLRFVTRADGKDELLDQLRKEWPEARFVEATERTGPTVHRLFAAIETDKEGHFHVVVKGTNFQVQVWQALLSIPPGAMLSYQDVATYIGAPTATRAVANAIAKNPIAFLIPCHRVISKVGGVHRYRWGSARKKAILGWEASRFVAATP